MNIFRRLTRPMTRGSGWKLAIIFGFSALLVLGLLLAQMHRVSAASTASGATITSDKQDYAPGATVTLTGAGWDSGEAVHIFVNDSVGNTWSLNSNPDPAADTNGSFSYSFSLPNSFIANYTATATGPTSGMATTTFTDSNSNCPSTDPTKWLTDNQVGASHTTSGNTATYTFSSFVNEHPVSGSPGLIYYCVYTTPLPASITPQAVGVGGALWQTGTATTPDRFSFERPNGNNNIPLDGTNTTMGTATWSSSVPTSQTIVLHVDDSAECQALYGSGSSSTCFVLPGTPQQQAKDLTVSKTATPSFTRTFTWGVTKSVDKSEIDIAQGGSATFNYTVSVTHNSGTDSGWQVTGKITVTNPNGSPVTGVDVTDTIDNNGSCSVTNGNGLTVPANNSIQVSYTCTYSSAPSPGSGNNTAKATWTDFGSPHTSATGTATYDFSSVIPTLVDDSVTVTDPNSPTNPLGTVTSADPSPKTFTYSHTFSGDPAGTCTSHDNTATFTTNTTGTKGSDSKTVKLCVGADLTVSKTAASSFTRTFKWGIAKSVDQTVIKQSGLTATFNYTVSVTHDGGTDSGWTVTGTITVKNPNDWEAITTDVSDAVDNGGSCIVTGGTGVIVPANGSQTLNYTCTYASAPSSPSGTNTATATWNKATYFTPSSSATGTAGVDFSTPTTIVDGTVTITDTLGGSWMVKSTDPSPMTFKYSNTVTGTAGTCVNQDNTATFTTNTSGTTGSASQSVKLCVGADLAVSKTASTGFMRNYTWGITKKVDSTHQNIAAGGTATFNYTVEVTHDAGTDSGWTASGTITVSNPNDWEAITANVTDAINTEPNASCVVTGGTNLTLAASGNPGATATLPYTCNYSDAPASNSETNTATASWDATAASTPDGLATGTAPVNFSMPTKVVDGSVTVTDPNSPTNPLGTVSYTDPSPTTFTYSHTFSGDPAGTCTSHGNTASFTTSDTHTSGSASQTVKVCVGADLTVSKTAIPYFTRTYNWSIAKVVDKTLVEQIGGTATFNYTVNVSETGFIDSAWQVAGTITVTNPNNWETITASAADVVDNGGICSVTGGTNVSVPAGGSVNLPYACTYTAAPSPSSGTNTATATWDSGTFFTPDGSASGSAKFAFTTPTTSVNKTVTVTDTFNGGTPTTLGTLTATDTKPYTSASYKYSHTVNVPQFNCVKYTNTAKIVETGQTSSQTVEVCGPARTGALTMGYWQNTNGQGIIAKSGPSSGTCALTTWLRQFAPFQDLSATAPCGSVGSTSNNDVVGYVYNVIKAANASGSSMNPMLKAQMLATALDVYFGGGPGGNPINAPVVIGNVTIDLAHICQMIDSSNSTATCSGTFENVSSAFGGATSLTVSQMLTYAASQSDTGGVHWYGNIKATQQLAKDAFDAINNQVAFSP